MIINVPGKQTVPRAETWAVLQVIKVMKGVKEMKIITDAMYVIKGFKNHNRKAQKATTGTSGEKCTYSWTE